MSGQAILIIDDEAVLARNIATYLQRLGWTTQIAGSAEEGLDLYPSFRPDIVLLDHNLPGQTGLDALVKLRAMDAEARVVLMTGNGGIELAVSAIKQGAADYLAKPLALSELRLLLERLLAQSRLQSRVEYYRQREADHSGLDKIIGESSQVTALRERICLIVGAERQLSDDNPPSVLIQGETGTGKELVARALHFGGARASQPFVELNCGALPPQLIEAELFGYEKGAFTDARQRKIGLVEAASGGTLFLDEIGEADPATQVKLLKLLEDRSFRRLGGIREQRANVRVIAATHRPLEQMVREGRFRADLYFRLRIIEVPVPALRERGTDVLLLARHFLQWHAQRYRRELPELGEELLLPLQRYPWPGNVRELRNAIEQALLLAPGPRIGLREFGFLSTASSQQLPQGSGDDDDADDLNLERAERRLVQRALQRSGSNVTQAAKLLGISRDTLRYRLERLNLRDEDAA
ncbi:sigma-54-dependent Fis family transcriptional regulator [Pelomonas sp. V22]|uniref:sigma-54-dependent transcriptional regulator n=1 Tax=Pelomonas sp. V22 TaxID=2822139 RepID=UPI0024A97BC0|nr:sigma-54 dependent transcriptional regulator [Pelomonas sp. V22]MDI4631886.1 sigma-54-dependent Fis family transcriptional regulator [Pelomonas sp. V22]